jgi:nicotinamidase-related amidase
MSTIVDLRRFRERGRGIPTLVLVDLHNDELSNLVTMRATGAANALANCRAALAHARARGFPVGFTRRVPAPANLAAPPAYPRWIKGFEPSRFDMVFDHWRPSCYASPEFAEMVECLAGDYVIAGQFGEMSCLSTAIDAFHRDHHPTFLTDAIVTCASEDNTGDSLERAVTQIISFYADVMTTQNWLLATAQRMRVRE